MLTLTHTATAATWIIFFSQHAKSWCIVPLFFVNILSVIGPGYAVLAGLITSYFCDIYTDRMREAWFQRDE